MFVSGATEWCWLPAGSFTALLGPSGCGKTTMLRLIAGFEAPSDDRVLFGDELMADPLRQVSPEARGVGVVFQSYALWPQMDVAEKRRLSAEGQARQKGRHPRQRRRGP